MPKSDTHGSSSTHWKSATSVLKPPQRASDRNRVTSEKASAARLAPPGLSGGRASRRSAPISGVQMMRLKRIVPVCIASPHQVEGQEHDGAAEEDERVVLHVAVLDVAPELPVHDDGRRSAVH